MALTLEQRVLVAQAALGRSVVAVNPRVVARLADGADPCLLASSLDGRLTYGVKDSAAIPREVLMRLAGDSGLLPLTIDHMADLGRSVDTELVNPLTYRPMTGSTSGGPINVLKGINDFCVGTDGGGSVLAPALATNLYALMAKGLGLVCEGKSRSTDRLAFRGGVGFIGRSLKVVLRAAEVASGEGLRCDSRPPAAVVVPTRGCVALPCGGDMRERLAPLLDVAGLGAEERDFCDLYEREPTVRDLRELWGERPCACVVTFEGPVDVFSADETIPRQFGGVGPSKVAGIRSKAQVKAVNMAGGSALCVPVGELACGMVVSCGPGAEALRGAVCVAGALEVAVRKTCPLPEVFERYFVDRAKPRCPVDVGAVFGL